MSNVPISRTRDSDCSYLGFIGKLTLLAHFLATQKEKSYIERAPSQVSGHVRRYP